MSKLRGPFGFTVSAPYTHMRSQHAGSGLPDFEPRVGWRVFLTGLGEEWHIADCWGSSHAHAVFELECFIAEAYEALAALRAQRGYPVTLDD